MTRAQFKALISLLLVLAAVISFCTLGPKYSDPDTYSSLAASIDRKTDDALRLSAGATLVSAVVTLLPDDVATPIADKVAEFTQYFLAAMCVLYAEKYMLPLIGLAAFRFLIPLCCALGIIWVWFRRQETLGRIAVKLTVFSVLVLLVIPVSIRASDIVYATYAGSIQAAISSAEKMTLDINMFSAGTGTAMLDAAAQLVNNLIEALAVTITTSCIIPLIVLVLFVWVAKILLGSESNRIPWNRLLPPPQSKKEMPAPAESK